MTSVGPWDKWQIHNGHKPTFFPGSTQVSAPPAATTPAADASVPTAVPSPSTTAAAPGEAPAGAPSPVAARHEVTTDVFKLVFNTEGGSLIGAVLLKHAEATQQSKDQSEQPFTLLTQGTDRIYVAQTGLIGGAFPTHKTPMSLVTSETSLADGQNELQVRFESADVGGVKLVKTYTLTRGRYDIAVKHEVQNLGTQAVSPQLYLQLVRDGSKLSSETPFYSTFTGPAVYTNEKKYQKVEFADIEKKKEDLYVKSSTDGYVAMVQHYFASAWLLGDGVARDNFARKVDDNLYAVGSITNLPAIEPGKAQNVQARLFIGPQEEKVLETIAPGLELVKDYGWLTILAKPLYWLLEKIHSFVANWGWSIVLLVVLIKAAFYWLNASAYRSMAKMKKINPRIMEMRERLKGTGRKGQPPGWLLPHPDPDPGVHRVVLGVAVQRRDAQRTVDGLDHRPVFARSVLHPAAGDGRDHHDPDRAQPAAAGSAAGQADVVDAADVLGDVLLLPVRPGAVLDHEQRADHLPAGVHQQGHGRAVEVQHAELQELTPLRR